MVVNHRSIDPFNTSVSSDTGVIGAELDGVSYPSIGVENGSYSYVNPKGDVIGEYVAPDSSGIFGDAFSAGKIGGTMQGIGAIAGAAAGIYDAYNKKKYQDKVFGMEEKRVTRETARQDKQQANYDKVFG